MHKDKLHPDHLLIVILLDTVYRYIKGKGVSCRKKCNEGIM